MADREITPERLREIVSYDPETGVFIKKHSDYRKVIGRVLGRARVTGYVYLWVDGRCYLAHRLAMFYMNGSWPKHDVDHINGNRSDNRYVNLREATRAQNMQNQRSALRGSASKYLGVSWDAKRKKWLAKIVVDGKRRYIGSFDLEEAARDAYLSAKRELHEFCTV